MRKYFIYPPAFGEDLWSKEGNPHIQRLCQMSLRDNIVFNNLDEKGLLNLAREIPPTEKITLLINWPDGLISKYIYKRFWMILTLGMPFLKNPLANLVAIYPLIRLRRTLKDESIDVIWFCHEIVSLDSRISKTFADKSIRKYLAMRSRTIICTELSTKRVFQDTFPNCSQKIVISPIGDYQEYYGPKIEKILARTKLGFNCSVPVVLVFGNSRHSDQLQPAIKAANLGKIFLLVAGRGFPEISKHPNIMSLSRFISADEVAILFSAADYLLKPNIDYLNSGVVRLAISYQLPVISGNYGATKDLARGSLIEISDWSGFDFDSLPVPNSEVYKAMVESATLRNLERSWNASYSGFREAMIQNETHTNS